MALLQCRSLSRALLRAGLAPAAARARASARHVRALATASAAAQEPVYVVFGATGGIGSELARQLHASGGRLLLVGRDAAKLDALAASLPGAHASRCANAAAAGEADAAIALAMERYGRVDGVANCIGSVVLKAAHMTSDAELAAVMETNLGTSFSVLRASVKAMTRAGAPGGSVVLCSSAVARFGLPNHEAIAAAKGAVAALALSAAATYAPQNVRVNVVSPGLVRSSRPAAGGIGARSALTRLAFGTRRRRARP
jgi:NAD(P)-dependent dehydrogenase (short-subunit alcohol dehydrogenase family)